MSLGELGSGRRGQNRLGSVLGGYSKDEVTRGPSEPPIPDAETTRFELGNEFFRAEPILPRVFQERAIRPSLERVDRDLFDCCWGGRRHW